MTQIQMNKAVILARGLGTRMRRAETEAELDERQTAVADSGVKALIPVGRPFLDYVLSALADAGYDRVCLVVAPDHEAIRRYYTEQVAVNRVQIEFDVQQRPKGTADAVAAAKPFARQDPFLVINSDNYYPPQALAALRRRHGMAAAMFDRQSMIAQGNVDQERLNQFGVARVDQRGFLQRIVEKPSAELLASLPEPVLVSMNCWRFGPPIFQACGAIGPSPRGEWEITTAVQYAIDELGQPFGVETVRAAVLDLTGRRDIAEVARRLADVEVRL